MKKLAVVAILLAVFSVNAQAAEPRSFFAKLSFNGTKDQLFLYDGGSAIFADWVPAYSDFARVQNFLGISQITNVYYRNSLTYTPIGVHVLRSFYVSDVKVANGFVTIYGKAQYEDNNIFNTPITGPEVRFEKTFEVKDFLKASADLPRLFDEIAAALKAYRVSSKGKGCKVFSLRN